MSKLKFRALLLQLTCFAPLFFIFHYLISSYLTLSGFWIPVCASIIATILAPKFQTIRTREGEKMYMKWLFSKEVKEITFKK